MTANTTLSPLDTPLTAGGTDPNYFDWQEVWYPVYYVEDLDKSKPTAFTLLERNIVIWWDKKATQWRVFDDQCPHRLAPLSEGRINEVGCLECPYHGWAFSGTGNCEIIPQQPPGGKAENSVRAKVKSLPAKVCQGLLFVYAGKAENADKISIPLVDVLEENADEWVCLNTFRDLPYDALTLLENVLDSSHIPYTHHQTVGNRANVSPVELEVVESGKWGFKGVWEEGPRKGTLGRQETTFIAPAMMWHDLTSKQFGRTLTVVYATPIRKGECRLFARFPFKFSSPFPKLFIKSTPTWYSHLGNNGVLEDDQIFLHHQERYLEEKGGSENFYKAFYLPTKADLFVFEFRSWVNQYKAQPFPQKTLSPVLSTETLLDRYHSHTKKCNSCRTALKNLQRVKIVVVIATSIIWAIIPLLLLTLDHPPLIWLGLLSSSFPLAVSLWFVLSNLEKQFYQGREIPPRNLPKK
ncbi:Rieske 2Fe-2S domain-containing protein [Crocosphaera sp. UHCC 0190]|uniref:aromatic ring-hydroxylating dioxygenase subunit alpha n=1 Tax=Crocosphaera sp. UHCC 0190 TaxID=3110246 RepID=UPI002B1FD668|nr:Rieske 2Fe-2S domain-containing protein [Crocosphaera sp. UHCC 0190]MEA5510132.1 Rieske 2Fe-2S domain-containing protein [Crocosphaera sp. UHCC 0190]